MLTRLDQLETGHTIRLSIFTFLASKKHILLLLLKRYFFLIIFYFFEYIKSTQYTLMIKNFYYSFPCIRISNIDIVVNQTTPKIVIKSANRFI